MFLKNWARLYVNLTQPEILLEREIARLGKRYRTQFPFFGARMIVDFALLDDRLIFEVDGSSHNAPTQRLKDISRTKYLQSQGWTVARCTNDEVFADAASALSLLFERSKYRPHQEELEKAYRLLLEQYPDALSKNTKPRGRGRGPAPKKAPSPSKPVARKSAPTTPDTPNR